MAPDDEDWIRDERAAADRPDLEWPPVPAGSRGHGGVSGFAAFSWLVAAAVAVAAAAAGVALALLFIRGA